MSISISYLKLESLSSKKLVLFPIKIDDSIGKSRKAWVKKIKHSRHIGDFKDWKEPEEYEKAFKRLLRDLKAEKG